MKFLTAVPLAALLLAGPAPAFASDDAPALEFETQAFFVDDDAPVSSIVPGDRFFFLYKIDNTESFPVKLVAANLNLTTSKPECDIYLTAAAGTGDDFPRILAPGKSAPFTDKSVWEFSDSAPNECQNFNVIEEFETTAFRVPSAMTAVAADHVEGAHTRFTATVETEWNHANGQVQFNVDGAPYGAPVALTSTTTPAGAQASAFLDIAESDLAAGAHMLVAEYIPDADAPAASFSAQVPFTVSPKAIVTPPTSPAPTPPAPTPPAPTTPPLDVEPPATDTVSTLSNPKTDLSAGKLATTGVSSPAFLGGAAALAALGLGLIAARARRALRTS